MYFYDFPIIGSESNMPLYLVNMGLHEQQPYTVREEGYSYPQILYCTKGSGTLVYEGQKHRIGDCSAVFIPANCPHEYFPDEDVWDIHWVVPSGFAVEELLKQFGLDRLHIFELGDVRTLEHNFRKMHEALMSDRIFGNYRAAGFLYDFLIELYRQMSAAGTAVTANSAVIRAVDYINTNYADEITMEELCEAAGVSKQHLCRLFRSALNTRPMEYAAKRRIQAAKELLTDTRATVDEISELTGFCTSSYFCKIFKRYEGMTPSQFRRGQISFQP